MKIKETRADYRPDELHIINQALQILSKRLKTQKAFTNPDTVKDYLRCSMHGLEHERFDVLLLDTKHRLIEHVPLFTGTLASTQVCPREVVKLALKHNAAAVILAHNHPSGEPEPSSADFTITEALKQTLALVDTKVLDHIVVTDTKTHSFAEHGQI